MLFPALEEVRTLSEQYSTIPVFWEVPADHWSPLQIYAALSQGAERAFLLESVNTPYAPWQTWSYIGSQPGLTVRVTDGYHEIIAFGSTSSGGTGRTLKLAEKLMAGRQSPQFPDMPEFTGGLAGFCSQSAADLDGLNCEFHLYDEVVAYNHLKSTAVIIVNLHAGTDIGAQYQAAEIRVSEIASQIERFRLNAQFRDDAPPLEEKWKADTRGEASAVHAPDSLELYRRMRSRFPAPYLCFFRQGEQQLAAASGTLTEELRTAGTIAGFWCNTGIRRTCRAEQSVKFVNTWDSRAYIACAEKNDTAALLGLMRDAKQENPTA